MSYNCTIVADSSNSFGIRIVTFLITFPRFILAEFNTHRVFTRNSASSTAIPFKKALRSVMTNPFIPIKWMKDHKGMQGTEYYTSSLKTFILKNLWLMARNMAVIFAWILNKIGLTKQICNRIIEPWMWHTALVTSTEWENFFSLRAHKAAEIHIQEIAYMMMNAYNYHTPVVLNDGEWHIPFLNLIDPDALKEILTKDGMVDEKEWLDAVIKISTAQCARTSYTNVGDDTKKINYLNDMKLHDTLAASGHWSPFEHIAKPMTKTEYCNFTRTSLLDNKDYEQWKDIWTADKHRGVSEYWDEPGLPEAYSVGIEYGWCGNFRGFIQYRKMFANENRSDNRIIKGEWKVPA
jgi:thymidylate synthase ThyX